MLLFHSWYDLIAPASRIDQIEEAVPQKCLNRGLARRRKPPDPVQLSLREKCQLACKPGSVWPSPCDENVAAIHLGRMLPRASRNLPGRWAGNSPRRFPFAPPLFGFAPGGVCLAAPVARRAVGSYPTLSPLPRQCRGGLLSVALSLGSPPPAVSRHRVSMEPGLSSPAAFRLSRARPPGQLASAYKGIPA